MFLPIRLYDSTVSCTVDLLDKVCVFKGDSGQGKTYLFDFITTFLYRSDLSYLHYSVRNLISSDINRDMMLRVCSEFHDAVIFDDADLYLTQDIYDVAKQNSDLVIISIHRYENIDYGECGYYDVIYNSDNISVKRL